MTCEKRPEGSGRVRPVNTRERVSQAEDSKCQSSEVEARLESVGKNKEAGLAGGGAIKGESHKKQIQ